MASEPRLHAYKIDYPGALPRMIEAVSRRSALRIAARSITAEKLDARGVHSLTEQGIDLESGQ